MSLNLCLIQKDVYIVATRHEALRVRHLFNEIPSKEKPLIGDIIKRIKDERLNENGVW